MKAYNNAITIAYKKSEKADMNCTRCHHTYQVHELNKGGVNSLLRVGRCLIPGCQCHQYMDKIESIDEELL